MSRLPLGLVAIGLVCGACQEPAPRLNAPPHGSAARVHELQEEYLHMTDNALLADMSVSDMHFIPNRASLNSLGEQRLDRLASLMELYGGAVRFSSDQTDEKLAAARLDTVRDYLCDAGIDTTEETVVVGPPASAGLDAPQVLLIKTNEGTYSPQKKSSSGDTGFTGSKTGQ